MFEKYSIKNFKIHQDSTDIEFPGLTILTGTNNSGKTSLIQSIRVLSKIENQFSGVPFLAFHKVNGLGELKDVLNKNVSRSESIEYNLYFRPMPSLGAHVTLRFGSVLQGNMQVAARQSDAAVLNELQLIMDEGGDQYHIYQILLTENGYIFARQEDGKRNVLGSVKFVGIQPATSFPEISDVREREKLQLCIHELNSLNEMFIRYLGPYRAVSAHVPDTGCSLLDVNGNNAAEVMAYWNDKSIFDGTPFMEAFAKWTSKLLKTEFAVRMDSSQYKLVAIESGVELSISQIGFGNTQILPVIVQILTALPGDLVIIENPEVHLHPKWKADLVELFLYAVNNGIKVVLETQSMEIINRTRLTVKNSPELAKKIAVYFFEKRGFSCEINRIDIKETGELDVWPEDFLDRVTIEDSVGLL